MFLIKFSLVTNSNEVSNAVPSSEQSTTSRQSTQDVSDRLDTLEEISTKLNKNKQREESSKNMGKTYLELIEILWNRTEFHFYNYTI